MKLLTTILIFIFLSHETYSQAWQWPNLDLYSKAGQVQIRDNIMYAVKRSTDSLSKVLHSEISIASIGSAKALKDSMATILYLDTNTMSNKNGSATVNYKPAYDSSSKVQSNLNSVNATLSKQVTDLSNTTKLEIAATNIKVSGLETRITAIEGWQNTVNAQLSVINAKVATIPKSAVSTSVSTTTTQTTTTLQ